MTDVVAVPDGVRVPDPEHSDTRVDELSALVRAALREGGVQVGGDRLVAPLVALLQNQCTEVRIRCATILRMLEERGDVLVGDAGVQPGGLGDLAFVMETHYVDEHGDIQAPALRDDEDPTEGEP